MEVKKNKESFHFSLGTKHPKPSKVYNLNKEALWNG